MNSIAAKPRMQAPIRRYCSCELMWGVSYRSHVLYCENDLSSAIMMRPMHSSHCFNAWRAMPMDLRRLNHVVALADTLHFARAAEAVHLSQPAFSRSIQAIESNLGIRLFDRDVGDVRPTPPDKFVTVRARKLLFEARCLHVDMELSRISQLDTT